MHCEWFSNRNLASKASISKINFVLTYCISMPFYFEPISIAAQLIVKRNKLNKKFNKNPDFQADIRLYPELRC